MSDTDRYRQLLETADPLDSYGDLAARLEDSIQNPPGPVPPACDLLPEPVEPVPDTETQYD